MLNRSRKEHVFTWEASTDSNPIDLADGAFGTLIVPTGSALIGKTLQFVAVSESDNFDPTELLTTAKTLKAGANALFSDDIAEVGAVGGCVLRVSESVSATATLLWKS